MAPSPPVFAPVRVLIVDDSAVVRQLLSEILSSDPGIQVVGTAPDPFVAREKIKQLAPDVLTLDVEMPRMDGLTFLRNLMRLRPMPVVMISTLTEAGAQVTLDALALGAVDFIPKPQSDLRRNLAAYADELIAKVRQAARARAVTAVADPTTPKVALPAQYRSDGRILAIGASTGGTEAIREVLSQLPEDAPPTVVVQHIPGTFSAAFAQRLDRHSRITVSEARDGDVLRTGHAYVAPGGRHLRVRRKGDGWACSIGDDEPVRLHRPSVDVLFDSLAQHAGARVTAALLTGMGDDGARGLLALRQAGAVTIAQDAPTSVVWGMPGAAVTLGAACEVVPLWQVAARLLTGTLAPAVPVACAKV